MNGTRRAITAGAAALAIGGAIAFAYSERHGNSATKECRQLREAQLSCTNGVEHACRALQERQPK